MKPQLIRCLKDPTYLAFALLKRAGWLVRNDELYMRCQYWLRLHQPLHLDHPTGYNEKLQWLKLRERHEEYTQLVDKAEVKAWVEARVGNSPIIPTLGVWERFDDIDFNALPERFVLKCTHDSGGLAVCTDRNRFRPQKARRKINHCLRKRFYWQSREYPYRDVKPRIIAEPFIGNSDGQLPDDYKFYCFDGEPQALLVMTGRPHHTCGDFYDMDFRHLPCRRDYPNAPTPMTAPPDGFEEMKALARTLSKGFRHVRVDLYNCDGHIYFGELTFFPGGGLIPFVPKEWDGIFGEWLHIDND